MPQYFVFSRKKTGDLLSSASCAEFGIQTLQLGWSFQAKQRRCRSKEENKWANVAQVNKLGKFQSIILGLVLHLSIRKFIRFCESLLPDFQAM